MPLGFRSTHVPQLDGSPRLTSTHLHSPPLTAPHLSCDSLPDFLAPRLDCQAEDELISEQKKERWLTKVQPADKTTIRASLLNNLLDENKTVRHTAAQCIGAVAAIDVPRVGLGVGLGLGFRLRFRCRCRFRFRFT